ncbi:uncharacterized protein LOC106958866 isoform X2 [Poecilia latipinna]|uniref:uncharacterized protein LOC106958866 isoform X2 n=1 Tax=Poecilia latipinna TaxID=48699 RepID=UPI00072E0028|nr:PREDICTED: uncharacterized protein LOC106958866 isoform X2 [Poecilia latipinna]
MDHRIILLLLLRTIQPLSVAIAESGCTKEITIGNCSKAWIINSNKINGIDVLKVACRHFNPSKFELVLRALPRDCSSSNAGTYSCLEVTVKGKKYKMCKKCCRNLCLAPAFCKICEERKEQYSASDFPLQVKIELKDSICDLSGTESTFDETSSSLQLFDETKSWIEALQYCDQQSSSLVEITNQTVLEELKTILANKTGLQKEVWVGLERSIFGTNVKWQWISGATAEQADWISSFPANGFNNHCGKIVWNNQSQTIQLLDANCHDKLPFICQDKTEMLED